MAPGDHEAYLREVASGWSAFTAANADRRARDAEDEAGGRRRRTAFDGCDDSCATSGPSRPSSNGDLDRHLPHEDVPAMFFDDVFDLSDPAVFRRALCPDDDDDDDDDDEASRTRAPTATAAPAVSSSSSHPPRRSRALFGLAAQARLGSYLDRIETSLVAAIGARSESFFEASARLHELDAFASETCEAIERTRRMLLDASTYAARARGVGREPPQQTREPRGVSGRVRTARDGARVPRRSRRVATRGRLRRKFRGVRGRSPRDRRTRRFRPGCVASRTSRVTSARRSARSWTRSWRSLFARRGSSPGRWDTSTRLAATTTTTTRPAAEDWSPATTRAALAAVRAAARDAGVEGVEDGAEDEEEDDSGEVSEDAEDHSRRAGLGPGEASAADARESLLPPLLALTRGATDRPGRIADAMRAWGRTAAADARACVRAACIACIAVVHPGRDPP